jgi:MarR family transcriptional regulator, organic hydroperoxide resistance regulator
VHNLIGDVKPPVRLPGVSDRLPQLELDNQLCFALYSASRAVTRSYGPLLAELGLTYPQYLVMLVLWEVDEAVTVGDLGLRLHLDSGTLTPLLKRLEHLGLVQRDRDPRDERRVLVTLTPAGAEMRARASDIPGRLFPRYGIDLATARALKDQLTRIATTVEDDDDSAR